MDFGLLSGELNDLKYSNHFTYDKLVKENLIHQTHIELIRKNIFTTTFSLSDHSSFIIKKLLEHDCYVYLHYSSGLEENLMKAIFNLFVSSFSNSIHPNNGENLNLLNHNLSSQEEIILSLVTKGVTDCDIMYEMKISRSTVRKHISSLFNKFNVSSRSELIAKYYIGFKE